MVARLGLSDSLWSLVVTYPTFLVPFCTWLLMGYFRTVPKEIEECAMLDGCNRLQTLVKILLPVAIPGVICAALFAFTLSWNEFLYALVFVSPAELKTMTVGVFSELIRGDIYYWGGLMAGRLHRLAPHRGGVRLLPGLLRVGIDGGGRQVEEAHHGESRPLRSPAIVAWREPAAVPRHLGRRRRHPGRRPSAGLRPDAASSRSCRSPASCPTPTRS